MKTLALALCVLVVVLTAAGFAQEKASAAEGPRLTETATDIWNFSRGEILRNLSCEPRLSKADLELMALVVTAEAEGESELGKRLVCDVILNRVDSPQFPDTIGNVIFQKYAFESIWNGRAERCVVTDETRALVRQEFNGRRNYEVIFFRTKYYCSYGSPLFREGNHYFSSL